MKTAAVCSLFFLLFTACSKKALDESVMIRVKNETAGKINDVKVYSFADTPSADLQKVYGNIDENTASTYLGYTEVYNIPLLSYTITGAGTIDIDKVRCTNPMPSTLPAGRYTLVISGDYTHPEVVFVKD
jgi:hypothetical protein